MKSILFFTTSLVLFLACSREEKLSLMQPQHYQLDNGLQLILIENHATPMIASVVIVGCGSRDERPELNGAAHMLEHLLFNGTTSRSQKELYDEIDFYGLYINAQTSRDYTSFMSVAPKRVFNKALEITADMLFNSVLPEDKLEKERGIVTEEIVKDLNDQEAQMRQQFAVWFYAGEPYERPVIGNKETVAHMTRAEIYDFYKTHYRPDNMQVLVIGDFDTAEMLRLFQVHMGEYAADTTAAESSPRQRNFYDQHGVVQEYQIASGRYVYFALPAPLIENRFAPAFDLWQEYYFGAGDRLQQMINESGRIISKLTASHEYYSRYANLIISARLDSAVSAETFYRRFMEVLKSESVNLQHSDVLDNTRTKRLVDEILLTEKLHYFGVMKSQLLVTGGIGAYQYILDQLPQVGAGDIEIINRILTEKDVNGQFTTRDRPSDLEKKQAQPALRRVARKKPESMEITLSNGMRGYLVSDQAAPIFALHLLVKDRSLREPQGKEGIADLAHRLLISGSVNYPGKALQEALNKIGATVKVTDSPFIPFDNYYNQPYFSYVRLTTLDQFAEDAIQLLAEMLYHPQWTGEELEKARQDQLFALSRSANQPAEMARQKLYASLYNHPAMGAHPQGRAEDVSAITLEEVQEFAKTYFQPHQLIITMHSALPLKKMQRLLQESFPRAVEAHPAESPYASVSVNPLPNALTHTVPGRTEQGYIYMAIQIKAVPDDQGALKLLSLMLSDKISFHLREQLGLAYSIGAGIEFKGNEAVLLVYMGTRKQNLERARNLLTAGIEGIPQWEIDQREIDKHVNAYSGRIYMRWIARDVRAYYNGIDLYQQNNPTFSRELLEAMISVTPTDLTRVAGKYFSDAPILTVLVD